jgi:sulfur carrier protein
MDVVVNGSEAQLDPATTVADVVRRFCPSPDGVAVARNGEVVPKSAWARTTLGTGDRLEIVTAAAGG